MTEVATPAPARRFTVRRGGPHPARRDARRRGHQLRPLLAARDVGRAAASSSATTRRGRSRRSCSSPPSTGRSTSGTSTWSASRRAWATPTGSTARRTSTASGHRFNPNKVLHRSVRPRHDLDAVGPGGGLRPGRQRRATRCSSVVIDMTDYDWEGDTPLNRPMQETVIYEMHVRRLHEVAHLGREQRRAPTSASIEKIPYLQELGVTAVELLPVFEFDEDEISGTNPLTGQQLINYWGYSPISFFNPHEGYCVAPDEGSPRPRVPGHGQGAPQGRHRGHPRRRLQPHRRGQPRGPDDQLPGPRQQRLLPPRAVRQAVLHEPVRLREHVQLQPSRWSRSSSPSACSSGSARCTSTASGSTSPRSCRAARTATPMDDPPVLWHIELDNELADTKIIAEAWDAGGLYQVGYFPGYRWAEWNGRFRDDIRRFVKGDKGLVGDGRRADRRQRRPLPGATASCRSTASTSSPPTTASRSTTSSRTTASTTRPTARATATAPTTTSAGTAASKGDTDDPAIEALRARQVRNFLAHPDAVAGRADDGHGRRGAADPVRQQQRLLPGQRDHLVRLDRAEEHADLVRFTSELIAFRKSHPTLRRNTFFTGEVNERGLDRHLVARLHLVQPGLGRPGVAGPRLHARRLPDAGDRQVEPTTRTST